MVARRGTGWELVPSLVWLETEINRAYPKRSMISDGSIGDLRHQASTSEHNPDASGDVRAIDITEDHVNGPDLRAMWNDIIRRRDPRVLYLIYERQIVKSYVDSRGRPAWVPQPYSGINAHEHHLHISVRDTVAGKTDLTTWLPTRTATPPPTIPEPSPEDDEMKVWLMRSKGDARVYLTDGALGWRWWIPNPTVLEETLYVLDKAGATILTPPKDAIDGHPQVWVVRSEFISAIPDKTPNALPTLAITIDDDAITEALKRALREGTN